MHLFCTVTAVASQWFTSGGISDLRTAQSSMRRGLAYSTRRVLWASIVILKVLAGSTLRGLRSRGRSLQTATCHGQTL